MFDDDFEIDPGRPNRMSSRVTAMDVESQEFPRKMRGYDPEEVRMFLRSLAAEIERLNLENANLREEAGRLRDRADEYRDREKSLRETLVTAQQMADELKERTRTETDLMVKEARLKSERMLERAQDQLAKIESDIGKARLERDLFENRLRSTIEEHEALLDLRKQERADEFDNLRFLRRRTAAEA
jgi:cell division initiation protein